MFNCKKLRFGEIMRRKSIQERLLLLLSLLYKKLTIFKQKHSVE